MNSEKQNEKRNVLFLWNENISTLTSNPNSWFLDASENKNLVTQICNSYQHSKINRHKFVMTKHSPVIAAYRDVSPRRSWDSSLRYEKPKKFGAEPVHSCTWAWIPPSASTSLLLIPERRVHIDYKQTHRWCTESHWMVWYDHCFLK